MQGDIHSHTSNVFLTTTQGNIQELAEKRAEAKAAAKAAAAAEGQEGKEAGPAAKRRKR
jgi:hypothetical protein